MASDFEDVIGPGTKVRGHIEGSSPLLIRGAVEGSVQLSDAVVIAAEGSIEAELSARTVAIEGSATGTLVGTERVALRDGCRVSGEVRTPTLIVEDGAHIAGRIEMNVELPEGVNAPSGRRS